MASINLLSNDAFMYQVHHIILPPKLPQRDDFNISHEHMLLKSVLSAMERFRGYIDDSSNFQAAIDMVQILISCRSGSSLNVDSVGAALRNLNDGCCLGFHLRSQNFGLLVTRRREVVHFEGFELLAQNSQVMKCKGRLRRSFPNTCIELDLHQFNISALQAVLADLLCQLDVTTHASCRPKSDKGSKKQDEERETIDPKLLLLVTGFLRGLGRQEKCNQILKHSREEVLWSDGAPWHRSAGWLFLRVSLQLVLERECETGRSLFKEFTAFFMAEMLQQGIPMSLPSHLLQCMLAKVNRRHLKLFTLPGTKVKPRWWSYTSKIMQQTSTSLQTTWSLIRQDDNRTIDLSKLQDLQFGSDIHLSLSSLKPYLNSISNLDRFISTRAVADLDLEFAFHRAISSALPNASFCDQDKYLKLVDFEHWVAENLETWSNIHPTSISICQNLGRLIEIYHLAASYAYDKNPVNLSTMWLTIMELWIVLDTSVVSKYPLLRQHKVGFPEGLLEPLTLPTKIQMMRLRKVEDYLMRREGEAKAYYPSAFEKPDGPRSFATRSYEAFEEYQILHSQILESAEKKRRAKLQELESMKSRYNSLKDRHDNDTHDQHDVEGFWGWEKQCRNNCSKCRLFTEMSSMKIAIYEWPLPQEEYAAKAVVFELRAPEHIVCWRRITLTLLIDMLKGKDAPNNPVEKVYWAREYHALSSFKSGESGRLQLGSTVKPFTVSHYRDMLVSDADASKVCQNHGCQYDYYDTHHMILQSSLSRESAIPQNCSFAHLSHFITPAWIRGYGHSSNEVLADQFMSPQHMTLDEFKAFGHLRSGVRVQWRNILVQLMVPSVNLNNVETALLLLQASYHAGPNIDDISNIYRDAHALLDNEEFGQSLLRGLQTALDRVEENWESEVTVLILSRLCARILSCASNSNIHQGCLAFLARIRSLSRRWVILLQEKWSSSTAEVDRSDLNDRVLKMALVCASTYDVGQTHFNVLFSTGEVTTWFIEVSIIIHDQRSQSSPGSPLTAIGLQLWQRISYEVQEIVAKCIQQSRACLDQAVKTFWQAYSPGHAWSPVDSGIRVHVLISESSGGLPVTFNLLDGSLLVNGRPLSRLPSKYQTHATYTRLFGTQVLEIVPSDQPGMEFSATRKQHDWTVHFAMAEEELIIRAHIGNSLWEFIPPSKLSGDFPTTFVNCYSHWVNLDTGMIEFRPCRAPWKSGGGLWSTLRVNNEMILQKGHLQLIDPKSKTARALAAIFEPIEHSDFVNIFLDTASHSLDIRLCRHNLSFMLEANSGAIRSKNYHSMSIDSNQSTHCLVGLEHRLILCPDPAMSHLMKIIIVPQGDVSSSRGKHGHPVTSSHPASSAEFLVGYPVVIPGRKHDCFRIDTTLGRLVDNGSLQSKLFLCHLHAATSHCLPDPLTGRTGTEEALRVLKSAAVASFVRFTQEDIHMLSKISLLSPRRQFYPPDKKVMQSIRWKTVYDPLAQNDEFFQIIQSLLREGMSREMFFPDDEKAIEELTGTESSLVKRALIRNSTFRVCGFGAENHTTDHDLDYKGRDDIKAPALEQLECQVFQITRNLLNENLYLLVQPSIDLQTLYNVMGEEVDGLTSPQSAITCTFDCRWLDKPSISIGRKWCKIQQHLSLIEWRDSKYDLMAFFSALVFAQDADLQVIQVLLAFTCSPALRILQQPRFPTFKLCDGNSVQISYLKKCLNENKCRFNSSPESRLQGDSYETLNQLNNRRQQAWNNKVAEMAEAFVSDLVQQWPTAGPNQPQGREFTTYFNVGAAMSQIRKCFTSWYKNMRLDQHLKVVIEQVEQLYMDPIPVSFFTSETNVDRTSKAPLQTHITAANLFSQISPQLKCKAPSEFNDWCRLASEMDPNSHHSDTSIIQEMSGNSTDSFQSLLDSLYGQSKSQHQHDYVDELQRSSESTNLEKDDRVVFLHELETRRDRLEQYMQFCSIQTKNMQECLFNCLSIAGHQVSITSSNSFPRLSPIFMLQQLNRHNWSKLPTEWQQCICEWAVSLTHLQRAERMLAAVSNANDFVKEVKNTGHLWSVMEFPEWLLLEVESGLMIRDVQVKISAQMKNSPTNACIQLNMGEGKSSVIVPIVASSLANGMQLVRILVAKPQSKQMHHMLVSKLGGILDRRVFCLPFSRSIKMNPAKVQQIQRILEKCMQTGGVLLVQPEHLLSLKLMGIEQLGSAGNGYDHSTGAQLVQVQNFLDAHSRDIIDESDENFSVKFELIYTIGAQKPVEMSPDRWVVIGHVLNLVQQCAPSVKEADPDGVYLKISGHSGQFPILRILTESATQALLQSVAHRVCKNGLHGLATAHQKPRIRAAIFAYITEVSLTHEIATLIEQDKTGFFDNATKSILLLLRGLFAGGVLAYVLGQKRWRVNFGLTSRNPPTLLAVPYRAKDSPAPRAEFSHPDIVITLTCLSYYYEGLSRHEVDVCLEQLKRSDQADNEFALWVKSSPNLQQAFHQLGGINLKDRGQFLEHVFPALRLSKAVIDFYLHTIVFPKEMVEFPHKLSASGWDLARSKTHPVTGFSGTCDSKYVLPLDIQQLDLPEQAHTNATVLKCLLRPQNTVKNLDSDVDSISLLEAVVSSNPSIDVLLDVGALIIEMSNLDVAQKWLELVTDTGKQAAIFIDDDDELRVIDRQGFIEPFLTSPYASHTDACLVFLDEAHTRGIDLRLPDHYRAATTLGPRLTKDRLTQACMRMRKLGKGQSIVFFVPYEIQQRIRISAGLSANSPTTIANVLCWAISETWHETKRSIPLWALQGLRCQRQEVIWDAKVKCNASLTFSSGDFDEYLEDEAMSLQERYRPKSQKATEVYAAHVKSPRLSARQAQLRLIKKKCEEFEVLTFGSATLQEEQERELAPEIEQERQVEKPPREVPLVHELHPDVRNLVQRGILSASGGGFLAAFGSLHHSSAAQLANTHEFGEELLVTADFARTIRLASTSCSDAFYRSVQWVLTIKSGSGSSALVILSPWEANELLPEIEKSNHVYLHCYAPRPNFSYLTLQDLKLFSTPSLPPGWTAPRHTVMQLNLFAGELYFESWDEYRELCTYLGLSYIPNTGFSNVAADGFVGQAMYPQCQFTCSPTFFLRTLLTNIRRNRQDISRTHVGMMLSGEIINGRDVTNMVQN